MTGRSARTRPIRLLITGGGTGGHLFPAVATAQALLRRLPESQVLFVGTNRALDRRRLEPYGFSVRTVHSHGLKGKRLPALVKALAVLPVTLAEACWHILSFRPHVVCGVGGYVTGPVVAAAWLLRRPTVIHEQNSVPGLANRKLGRLVDRVCVSLPDSGSCFPAGKTVVTGNPVRDQILAVRTAGKKVGEPPTLLILGGSQGAQAINRLMVEVLTGGDRGLSEVSVIHQTGRVDEEMVTAAYAAAGVKARVAAFITDMAEVYERADLVVSRAGATTLAELAVLGKPAVLIPYPFAADNHQEKNGAWYAAAGGARLLAQDGLTAGHLSAEIKRILTDRDKRTEMGLAMRGLGIGDAADRIVDICLEMAGAE